MFPTYLSLLRAIFFEHTHGPLAVRSIRLMCQRCLLPLFFDVSIILSATLFKKKDVFLGYISDQGDCPGPPNVRLTRQHARADHATVQSPRLTCKNNSRREILLGWSKKAQRPEPPILLFGPNCFQPLEYHVFVTTFSIPLARPGWFQ